MLQPELDTPITTDTNSNLTIIEGGISDSDSPKRSENINAATSKSPTVSNSNATPSTSPSKRADRWRHSTVSLLSLDRSDNKSREMRFLNEEALAKLEQNYKLQIDALLEQVHQLKIDKKIVEKKLEYANKGLSGNESFSKPRSSKCTSDQCSMILASKDSTIKELEFQVEKLTQENQILKAAIESQKNEIEKMSRDINENSFLKLQIQEARDEISLLKQRVSMEKSKTQRAGQEIRQVKSENVSLKLRSHNNSFLELVQASNYSHVQSLASVPEWATKRNSQTGEFTGDGTKDTIYTTSLSPLTTPVKRRNLSMLSGSKKDLSDFYNGKISPIRNGIGQYTSLKTLNEYERALQEEIKKKPDSAPKLNCRLMEIRKIKGFYLEQENQKLMSLVEKPQPRDASFEDTQVSTSKLFQYDINVIDSDTLNKDTQLLTTN